MGDVSESNNRIKFISYLQILGIILVVLGHSFHEYPDGNQGKDMLMYRMMYNFRMPLFMFVSGFLMVFTTVMRPTGYPSFTEFTLKKIKRLLLPFIVLTSVTFVPRAMMSGVADDPIDLSLSSFLRSFVFTDNLVIPIYWFIQSSFTLLVFSYAVVVFAVKKKIHPIFTFSFLIIIIIILSIVDTGVYRIFSLYGTIYFGVYFLLGCVYCYGYKFIDKYIPWTNYGFLFLIIIVWVTSFILLQNTEYKRLVSVVGIVMCICFTKIMVKYKWNFLDHLVGTNYIIFLLSWYVNVLSQQVLSHFVVLPWWCYTILSLIGGIYIPWLFYRYLCNSKERKHSKIIAFLLGQNLR